MGRKKAYLVLTLVYILTIFTMSAQEMRDAIRNGNLDIVAGLVKENPSLVCSKVDRYSSPLHLASRNGRYYIVKFLVENGAEINAVSKYQGTPLDLAIESENSEIVEYLRSAGGVTSSMPLLSCRLDDNILRITFPYGMRNNIIAFRGNEGLLIIDSGFGKRVSGVLKEEITGFDPGQIRYVVNTHSHGDHVAGNKLLAPSDSAIIGLGRILENRLNDIISPCSDSTGSSGHYFPGLYRMYFNNEDILFIPVPDLHSSDDMLIYFHSAGILCMGDLLLSQNCPAIGSHIKDYIEFLDRVADAFPKETVFVCGHGRDLKANELINYRNDLVEMYDIVSEEYAKKKSVEQSIRENILKDFKEEYSFLDWLDPDSYIRTVYRDLAAEKTQP